MARGKQGSSSSGRGKGSKPSGSGTQSRPNATSHSSSSSGAGKGKGKAQRPTAAEKGKAEETVAVPLPSVHELIEDEVEAYRATVGKWCNTFSHAVDTSILKTLEKDNAKVRQGTTSSSHPWQHYHREVATKIAIADLYRKIGYSQDRRFTLFSANNREKTLIDNLNAYLSRGGFKAWVCEPCVVNWGLTPKDNVRALPGDVMVLPKIWLYVDNYYLDHTYFEANGAEFVFSVLHPFPNHDDFGIFAEAAWYVKDDLVYYSVAEGDVRLAAHPTAYHMSHETIRAGWSSTASHLICHKSQEFGNTMIFVVSEHSRVRSTKCGVDSYENSQTLVIDTLSQSFQQQWIAKPCMVGFAALPPILRPLVMNKFKESRRFLKSHVQTARALKTTNPNAFGFTNFSTAVMREITATKSYKMLLRLESDDWNFSRNYALSLAFAVYFEDCSSFWVLAQSYLGAHGSDMDATKKAFDAYSGEEIAMTPFTTFFQHAALMAVAKVGSVALQHYFPVLSHIPIAPVIGALWGLVEAPGTIKTRIIRAGCLATYVHYTKLGFILHPLHNFLAPLTNWPTCFAPCTGLLSTVRNLFSSVINTVRTWFNPYYTDGWVKAVHHSQYTDREMQPDESYTHGPISDELLKIPKVDCKQPKEFDDDPTVKIKETGIPQEPEQGKVGAYCVVRTGWPLLVPNHSAWNAYWMTHYRLAIRPVYYKDQKEYVGDCFIHAILDQLEKFYEADTCNNLTLEAVRYYEDMPDFPEAYEELYEIWYDHTDPSKRKVYNSAKTIVDKLPFTPEHKFVNTLATSCKCDEALLKTDAVPRPVHRVDPKLTVMIGPFIWAATEKIKRWYFYRFFWENKSLNLRIYLTYGAGLTDLELDRWFQFALDKEGIHIIASGDDSLVVLSLEDTLYLLEGDFSKFDHSIRLHLLEIEWVALGHFGVPFAVLDILEANAVAKLRIEYKQYKATVNRAHERNTGGTDTTVGNTLIVLLILAAAARYLDSDYMGPQYSHEENIDFIKNWFQNFCERFGLQIKCAVWGGKKSGLGTTFYPGSFLKGTWWGVNNTWFWGPLPSRFVKLTKLLQDPQRVYGFYQDARVNYRTAIRAHCIAVAKMMQNVVWPLELKQVFSKHLLSPSAELVAPLKEKRTWSAKNVRTDCPLFSFADVSDQMAWYYSDHTLANMVEVAGELHHFSTVVLKVNPGDYFSHPFLNRTVRRDYN